MTSPVEGAYVVRDASVTLDTVEYANQLGRFRLIPDQPVQTYRTAVPNGAVQDVDSPTWTFDVSGLQVSETGGLARQLNSLEIGAEVDVVLVPSKVDGRQQAAFTIKALKVEFGGEQGNFATFERVFPVVGQPVFTDYDGTP